MTFPPGSLVRARGRDWVVLPESGPIGHGDLVVVRPLGGGDDEITAILTAVEDVAAAEFAAPDPSDAELDLAADDLTRVIGRLPQLRPHLAGEAQARAERLRTAHARVRDAGRQAGSTRIDVEPHLPVDVLGLYVYLPTVTA